MAFKKFFASADNTITDASKFGSATRATGSNMGLADALEVFKVYGSITTSSIETSRILIEFDTSEISTQRTAGNIPASGSVNFFLNLYNARTPFTVPSGSTLLLQPVSRSWVEGRGLDMDEYKDLGKSNWVSSSATTAWTTAGGDYLSTYNVTASLTTGLEDVSVDVTDLVEAWISGTTTNYGWGVHLSGSAETNDQTYYTKKFFSRSSEFFFKRPTIEARWDSSVKDQRGDFYASSSLLSTDNIQEIYLYNYFRGTLQNIPSVGTGAIYVQLFTSASGGTNLSASVSVTYPVVGGYTDVGMYSASFDLDTTRSTVYDRWYNAALDTCFFTGTLEVKSLTAQANAKQEPLVLAVTNLEDKYSRSETNTRVRLFTRKRNWSPTLYTVANNTIENYFVDNMYYKVSRMIDNTDVISYGTGSVEYTLLSYDDQGSYFDFDFSSLEAGYAYEFKFIIKEGSNYSEYPEGFRFRVED
jgi:hypothetical protein